MLCVQGGPEQGIWRIVGKVLFHLDRWTAEFGAGSGIFRIGDLKTAEMHAPGKLAAWIRDDQIPQGQEYLVRRDQKRKGPPNPKLTVKRGPRRKEGPTSPMAGVS